MRLTTRVTALFILNTCIALALFTSAYYFYERREIAKAQRAGQVEAAEKTASVCRTIATSASPVAALNYLAVLRRERSIRSASCMDPAGRYLAHTDPEKIGASVEPELARALADPASRRAAWPGGSHAWHAPVELGGRGLGLATIEYDPAVLAEDARLRLRETLRKPALIAAATFAVSIAIGVLLAWSLSRPIAQLIDASRAIGRGELDFRTPIAARPDELGGLAQEMNAMADQLKLIDEMKDEFISYVSHDLRNPMAAMTMYIDDILADDRSRRNLSPKHQELLGMIKENATRLSLFISNVLNAAKRKAGKLQYHLQPVDPAATLSSVKALFEIVARSAGVELRLDAPAGLPNVNADPEHFEHVVMNLVSNAVKFTDEGGAVTLSAKAEGARVRISVADTGRGIEPNALDRLFQRFSQIDSARQRAQGIRGSGLGLHLVKESVEAMGGAVSVESRPGKGSTFSIDLPAAERRAVS